MLVMAKINGSFATGYDRVSTELKQIGDIFDVKNPEYAIECFNSGTLAPIILDVKTVEATVIEPDIVESVVIENKVDSEGNVDQINATPQAIELAKELGIDIANVKSKTGRVTVLDVKNYNKDAIV